MPVDSYDTIERNFADRPPVRMTIQIVFGYRIIDYTLNTHKYC